MWFFSPRKNRRPTSTRRPRPGYRPRLESLEDRCVPSAPGTLDSSFGSGGIVTTSFGTKSNDSGFAVAVQADGRIVAAGVSPNGAKQYLDLIRYNPNGALDNSFGNGGELQTRLSGNVSGPPQNGLVIQPDGKILALMFLRSDSGYGTLELVRYTSTGALDTTFNGTGMVNTSFSFSADIARGLALETVNGMTKLVACASVNVNSQEAMALARYNLNGSLDTSFGSGGKVVTAIGYADSASMAIQADGKIIVAGASPSSPYSFVLARFDTSGNLDPTFGNAGIATTLSGLDGAVIVQPDGKIVEAGRTNTGSGWVWSLERVNSDGSLDSTFANGGLAEGPFSGSTSIRALTLQANGKLVAAGESPNSGFRLARYNPDGSLDTSFGSGGQVTTAINGSGESYALALQADGNILAAGFANKSTNNTSSAIALARYWGDPVPVIGSFSATPNPVKSGSSVTLTASNITDANPGATITQVAFYLAPSTGNFQLNSNDTLLGYATQTSPGVWTFTFTVNLAPGSYTIFAQAEDSLGIFSYADALTLTVQ